MTSDDIRHMSAIDLLDMDYFLNDEDTDDVGEEGFYIFYRFGINIDMENPVFTELSFNP